MIQPTPQATYRRTRGVRHLLAALDRAVGQMTYRIRECKRWREFLASSLLCVRRPVLLRSLSWLHRADEVNVLANENGLNSANRGHTRAHCAGHAWPRTRTDHPASRHLLASRAHRTWMMMGRATTVARAAGSMARYSGHSVRCSTRSACLATSDIDRA